jgi:hypothetical protein
MAPEDAPALVCVKDCVRQPRNNAAQHREDAEERPRVHSCVPLADSLKRDSPAVKSPPVPPRRMRVKVSCHRHSGTTWGDGGCRAPPLG